MKTTIELPDDLLIEAKKVAAERRTTLKDMVTRSLRREIGLDHPQRPAPDSPFEVGPLGILRLKKRGEKITSEQVRQMIEEGEDEEVRSAIAFREGKEL